MPPLIQKYSNNAVRATLACTPRRPPSQTASYLPPPSQSIKGQEEKSIGAGVLMAIIVSCGLFTFVFLSCFFGCWKPIMDRWKPRNTLKDRDEARDGLSRTRTNTDGTVSNGTSHENSSGSDADSPHDTVINGIIARHVFEDREHKAYRAEMKSRRLARAQDVMRSSQGLTLPVHFRRLKGRMKALSKSLAGTEVVSTSETSEQYDSASSACSHRIRPDLEKGDPANTETLESACESEMPLNTTPGSSNEDRPNMRRTHSNSTILLNASSSNSPPTDRAHTHANSGGTLETKVYETQI